MADQATQLPLENEALVPRRRLTSGEKPPPARLKYKHAVMIANMIQPYIREFQHMQTMQRKSKDDEKPDAQAVGIELFERMLIQAADDMTALLASLMECPEEDVMEVELDHLLTWFEETWEHNDVPGFIDRVKGLTKRFSTSQLQNLSNASTVGQTQN